MADPIKHDFLSGTATTAWETAKGTVKGALFPTAAGVAGGGSVGAIGGAAMLGVIGAVAGAIFAAPAIVSALGVGALAAAVIGGVGGLLTGGFVGAVAGGASGAYAGGAVGTIVGALTLPYTAAAGAILGVFKGGHRVSQESQAYQNKVENRALAGMTKIEYARNLGRQEGAMAMQQAIAEQLNAQRMESIAAQMGPKPTKNWQKTEDQRREQAAGAAPSVA